MFLAPGATYPGIPLQFAYPAAVGDLLILASRIAQSWDKLLARVR